MDYPKQKGEGFSNFYDYETYRIWDKNIKFPNDFKGSLLNTFKNKIIISSTERCYWI